jgi:competence protein CoiA
MFIAHDSNGNRVNSLLNDETTLERRAKNNEIFCPECGNNLRFRAGTFRPHFWHGKHNCTYSYSEPESETHIKGKTLLYEWLKSLYPNANVQLEWKIEETNQRSDVIVIHENGERWAFEFQCTPISDSAWLERHYLYKQAGVRDFWIMSSNVNRYIYEKDKSFRLSRDIEKAIFNASGLAYYLDVDRQLFHVIRGGEFETKTILINSDYFFAQPIKESRIVGLEIWNQKILRHYAHVDRIEKVENNANLYDIVAEELDRIQKLEQIEIRKKQNDYYKTLVNTRNNEITYLTAQEKKILKSLCAKHHYSLESLPGFYFCDVPYDDILTPGLLIQLWLYDQMLFGKSKNNYKHGFPTLWAPNCLRALSKLRRMGGYRVKKQEGTIIWRDPDKDLINDILEFWCNVGLTQQMGRRDRFYYRILCDYLPPHETLKESLFIEWYFRPNPRGVPTPAEVSDTAKNYRKTFRLIKP